MSGITDALKAALRVWVFTTIGLWIPGLLGWIREVTQWADQKGAPAFPDPSNLGYLFVAALTAAFPAAVAGVVRWAENASGHTVLPRASGPTPPADDRGGADLGTAVAVLLLIVLAVVLVRLLG